MASEPAFTGALAAMNLRSLKEPDALAVIAASAFLGYGRDKREVCKRRESRRVLCRQYRREGEEFAVSDDAGTTPQVDDAGLARSGPAMVGPYQTDGAVATVDEAGLPSSRTAPRNAASRLAC